MQPCHIWQDTVWTDRKACDKAPCDWIMKAAGREVPEMAEFAGTVNDYRQQLAAGTVKHVNSARAESTNDKVKKPETRKRLPIAFGKLGAIELATARARRQAEAEARRAETKAGAAARRKRKRR